MNITRLKTLSQKDYQRILKRSTGTNLKIMPQVRESMERIRNYGDKALIESFKKRFGNENYKTLLVNKEEIKQAYEEVNKEFIEGLNQIIKNITSVHQAQLPRKKETVVNPEKGISVTRVWRPIEKVGLYIPGGKAIYPSSVLMSAIPAQISGCEEIIMCSPARGNGQIPAPTLVAADMVGLTKINQLENVAEIFILVGDENYWNKGIGTHAMNYIIDHAQDNLKLKELNLSVHKDNIPAIQLFSKIGFNKFSSSEKEIEMKKNLRETE